MARPNPPGVSSTPSGRGFLFIFQTLRGARLDQSVSREEKSLREAPEVRDERGAKASADGARHAKYGNNLRVGSRERDVGEAAQAWQGLWGVARIWLGIQV